MFFTNGWIKRLRTPFVECYKNVFFHTFKNMLLSLKSFVTLNTLTSWLRFMSSFLNVGFKGKSSQILYHHGSWCARVITTSFSHSLYMEMKRSFMLFPLVALFIAVCRFISWFHLRFCRLFWGKPLKCVSDSKQSSSRFPAQLASSPYENKRKRRKKTNKLRFQSETTQNLKLKSIQWCP